MARIGPILPYAVAQYRCIKMQEGMLQYKQPDLTSVTPLGTPPQIADSCMPMSQSTGHYAEESLASPVCISRFEILPALPVTKSCVQLPLEPSDCTKNELQVTLQEVQIQKPPQAHAVIRPHARIAVEGRTNSLPMLVASVKQGETKCPEWNASALDSAILNKHENGT